LPKTVKFLGISLRTRWVILFALVLFALTHLPFRSPWLDLPSGMLLTLTLVAMAIQSIWLATSQWTRTPQHVRLVLSTLLMVVCWLCWATIAAWATFTLNKPGQAPPAFFQLAMTGMACLVVGAGLYVRPSAAVPDGTEEPSRG
jgi:multisubunit Na+/H+ antiporter MnhB subunit